MPETQRERAPARLPVIARFSRAVPHPKSRTNTLERVIRHSQGIKLLGRKRNHAPAHLLENRSLVIITSTTTRIKVIGIAVILHGKSRFGPCNVHGQVFPPMNRSQSLINRKTKVELRLWNASPTLRPRKEHAHRTSYLTPRGGSFNGVLQTSKCFLCTIRIDCDGPIEILLESL